MITSGFRKSLFQNWLSLGGLVVVSGSLFAFLLLTVFDLTAGAQNPYVAILAYMVAPAFLFLGLGLIAVGYIWHRRQAAKADTALRPSVLVVDLANPTSTRKLIIFVVIAVGFLLLSAIGSYQTFHFTESVHFCGQACHEVMEPEYTTYLHSPHARVACTHCHIGPGAKWYVQAKISGLYQVYSTAFKKYHRPIATPVANLRPAQETCEQCHWPQKFTGNLERTYNHFLTDDDNAYYGVRMLLRVGGGDPKNGPVGGIHWHMNVANKVEYIATDPKRQVIPWLRVTKPDGTVTEFRTKDFKDDPSKFEVRTMDCIDCHNRPSHIYKTPNDSVDLALLLGRIDPSMPGVKRAAVDFLTQPYSTKAEALDKIAASMKAKYADHPKLEEATREVQRIYSDNFFPLMKADWRAYPNNIGHKDWPGCFRCHDDQHKSADGKQVIKGSECNACHIILAEGKKEDLQNLNAAGLTYKHPEEGWEGMKCSDCHTGKND